MSNIDNHFMLNNAFSYVKKENYTVQVANFVESFRNVIESVISEYDNLEERIKTKPCKAFKEKMDGLARLKELYDREEFQNLIYWYIDEPKQHNTPA